MWDNPYPRWEERKIWHNPCLQASHDESEIRCRHLRSKPVRKDRIWRLVIPDKCYRNSVRGMPGLGGSGDSWEEVQLGSTLATRIKMPQRGWGKHAKYNKQHLPRARAGAIQVDIEQSVSLGWRTMHSKVHQPVLGSLRTTDSPREPWGLHGQQYK